MNELGDYLKELRKEKSLSIRKASEEIGISHTYLDSLEKGYDPRTKKERSPTPEVLGKMAKYYDVPFFELLNMSGYFKDVGEFDNEEMLDFVENTLMVENDDEIKLDKLTTGVSLGKRIVVGADTKLTLNDSGIVMVIARKLALNLAKRKNPLRPEDINKLNQCIDNINEGDK